MILKSNGLAVYAIDIAEARIGKDDPANGSIGNSPVLGI
jgi:hypothetical protein